MSVSATSPSEAPVSWGSDAQRAIDHALSDLVAHLEHLPGASIAAIDRNGRLIEAAAGVADIATGEPLTPRHIMRTASSTKPFVATAVLDLVARGLVELDTPASTFLPPQIAPLLDTTPGAAPITVRQLLQHTSGLDDYSSGERFLARVADDPQREWTAVEAVTAGLAIPRLGPPGERFSYSDTGYVVLGQIVEHMSGAPLHEVVRRSARLDELGMTATTWERFEPDAGPRAHQYMEGADTFDWNGTFDLFGGGGLLSTPADLCRFWLDLAFHRASQHLDRPVATTDGDIPFPPGDHMGLGVFTGTIAEHPFVGHGGFWGTRDLALLDVGLAVAVFTTNRTIHLDTRPTVAVPLIELLVDLATSTSPSR